MNKKKLRDAVHSIETYLSKDWSTSDETLQRIGQALQAGKLVVIKNAFSASFAEQMFRSLQQCPAWGLRERCTDNVYYHFHYVDSPLPAALDFCKAVFSSELTKKFVQKLSNRDCSSVTEMSASWYQPGDFLMPHNDMSSGRQVAYVWHLSKDWHPTWGGDFFWSQSNRFVHPSFNTLLLFTVSHHSVHLVTQVLPTARSMRLAIGGWWTSQDVVACCDGQHVIADENSAIQIV